MMSEKIVIDWSKTRLTLRSMLYTGAFDGGKLSPRISAAIGRSAIKHNDLKAKAVIREIAKIDIKYGISVDEALGYT